MTDKIEAYRNRWKRCRYCKHYVRVVQPCDEFCDFVYLECAVKDKIIYHPDMLKPFCSVYEPRSGEDNEIQTIQR